MKNNGRLPFEPNQLKPLDPEKYRFIWLHPKTLFGQLPIAKAVAQVDRQVLEPILGANKIQLFRNFQAVKIIPTGYSFLLQGTKPINGKMSNRPFLDILATPSPVPKDHPKAYVRLTEPQCYKAIAQLMEHRLHYCVTTPYITTQFEKLTAQSQPVNFFPRILDSILSPSAFSAIAKLSRIRTYFNVETHSIDIHDLDNAYLFSLSPEDLAYRVLVHVISECGYYQAYDYPLPEVMQKSLIILSIQGKVKLPYLYLKPRIRHIFSQDLPDSEEITIELIQTGTIEDSRLIFSSTQISTRLYPYLRLTDEHTPELLGLLYGFAYPRQTQSGAWQKASIFFRFVSLYELFHDEDFHHFQLTQVPLSMLLQIEFDSETRNELMTLADQQKVEVKFLDLSEGLYVDVRLCFRNPQDAQVSPRLGIGEVILSHYNAHFYSCIELLTNLWSESEERLRFLDANWINKLVERLRPVGNYWLSYFELQPHLQRMAESPDAEISGLVQKLFDDVVVPPRPYFRYFLGIKDETLILSPYPVFLNKWSTAEINPNITDENSLKLNIFSARTPAYMGFCRKALGLAKELLDLGAPQGEERIRFNIPKIVRKIETHTLAFLQRHIPPFPEVIDRLQSMLLDMSLYAPQTYTQYLSGYPSNDLLSRMKKRFYELTPSLTPPLNLLDPIYTIPYTQDAEMKQYLDDWKKLNYPNSQVLELMLQVLRLANRQKRSQVEKIQSDLTEAIVLRLDTLLKSIQAMTHYEVQVIARQPQNILTIPAVQERIQQLLTLSENMESECHSILHRLLETEPSPPKSR